MEKYFNNKKVIIAGPCSVESEEQVMNVAKQLDANAQISALRGGIWKPRTRPNCFEGVGAMGLKWLKQAGNAIGKPVTTEVARPSHVEECLKEGIDMLWIGARTTVNPFLVQELADSLKNVDIPVLVKNPVSADLNLWLGAIERLQLAGVKNLIAIHRGFYSRKGKFRNQPDWYIPLNLRMLKPEIPIICDPSHIAGSSDFIAEISQKSMDLVFDGIMVEVHTDPARSFSDAEQQITPVQFGDMLSNLRIPKEDVDSSTQMALEQLREEIHDIDHSILRQLSQRMELSKKIGALKREENISKHQPEHWKSLVLERIKMGKDLELDPEFVSDIYKYIHEESIKRQ